MAAEWDTEPIAFDRTAIDQVGDQLRVEAFEAFVHSQKPATTPWHPTAAVPYDFESRKAVEGIHPQLIKDVFQPTSVLDAGCGPDAFFVRLLRDLGLEARGFDVQLAHTRRHGPPPHLCYADLAMPIGTFPVRATGTADVVICREVLEHLTIPHLRRAVANLVRLSSRFVYVTTRYCANPSHLLSVDGHDDLDPDHRTMLTKPFLRLLFVLEGCTSRPDLEARMDHQGKGRCLVMEVGA